MLNFEQIERDADALARRFVDARPFEHVAVDNFCDDAKLRALYEQIPDPIEQNINKSRDYMFARNKYEKSGFKDLSPLFAELFDDLMSDRFQTWLQQVTGQPVFIDPEFHGGGIHQGGAGSYLDMHADFNTHPLHKDWFRNLNVLIYLNRDWQPAYKGHLKLRHRDKPEEPAIEVEPLFNRCVIMFTRDHTLHGYDPISFPEGHYRRSLAAYAYTPMEAGAELDHRSTVWYPQEGGVAKSLIGRAWPTLVKVKSAVLGAGGTGKNK